MGERPLTLIVTTEDLRPWRNFGAHFAILQDKRFTRWAGKATSPATRNRW